MYQNQYRITKNVKILIINDTKHTPWGVNVAVWISALLYQENWLTITGLNTELVGMLSSCKKLKASSEIGKR